MSPLLFLAIAVAVPLLGMLVLGLGARAKRKKVTDDQTEPFRHRLESLAPPERPDAAGSPTGTPGLMGAMRRRRTGRAAGRGRVATVTGYEPAPHIPAPRQPRPSSIRLIEHRHRGRVLPPPGTERDEPPQPDRVIPSDQRRRPGS